MGGQEGGGGERYDFSVATDCTIIYLFMPPPQEVCSIYITPCLDFEEKNRQLYVILSIIISGNIFI